MAKTKRADKRAPFLAPPTKDEVDNFRVTGLNGPTLNHLNFDVTGFSIRSGWNKECASILAEAYVTSQGAIETDRAKVIAAIMSHIPALVKQYARMNPSSDPKVRAKSAAETIANARAARRRNVSLSQRYRSTHLLTSSLP